MNYDWSMALWKGILFAGLLTGITDGLFATVSAWLFGTPIDRLWKGVASVLVGADAMKGGNEMVLLGILMHFGVAFGWSLVFGLVMMRAAWIRKQLASSFGVLKVAAVYGPLIWVVMSLVVIPALTHRPPAISSRWWNQLVGHAVFVGLPMVGMIHRIGQRH